jgi:hypothetical protein
MGLGGPVWHVSTASQRLALPLHALEELAYDALGPVGDADLGEWKENGRAFHLRRRLSGREQQQVGPVIDVRANHEGWKRWAAMQSHLPAALRGGAVL